MKSSASESKAFQSRSKGEIPGRARWKEWLSRSKLKQAFLIDSEAKLFMYLIKCIRFGSWKVWHLNRALVWLYFKNMMRENTCTVRDRRCWMIVVQKCHCLLLNKVISCYANSWQTSIGWPTFIKWQLVGTLGVAVWWRFNCIIFWHLPTYPSPKPLICLKWEVSVIALA